MKATLTKLTAAVILVLTLFGSCGCAILNYYLHDTPLTTARVIPTATYAAPKPTPEPTLYTFTAKELVNADSMIAFVAASGKEGFDLSKADDSFAAYLMNRYFIKQVVTAKPELASFTVGVYLAVLSNSPTYELPDGYNLVIDDMRLAMNALLHDCPELMNVKGSYTYYASDAGRVSKLEFKYKMKHDAFVDALTKTYKKVKSWCTSDKIGTTMYSKEKYIYTRIIETCTYSRAKELVDTAYGAMILKYALCEGYADAFIMCMHYLGIECLRVTGDATDIDTGNVEAHAWAIVKIDGEYYHADPTWDDYDPDKVSETKYSYFNTTDAEMYSHRVLSDTYQTLLLPKCTATAANYYHKNGLYVTADKVAKDVYVGYLNDIAANLNGKTSKRLMLKFENMTMIDEILNGQNSWTDDWNNDSGKDIYISGYRYSYSRTSKTFYIVFEFAAKKQKIG